MSGKARSTAFMVGVGGGLALGFLFWSRIQQQYRRDLFSRHPVRRFAALGYLRSRPNLETVHLLREYIAWESRHALRRRGKRMLREIESAIK
jgi:hypothetical protein